MKRNRTPIIIGVGSLLLIAFVFLNSNTFNQDGPTMEGNVRQFALLSLVQNTQRMDCDAFNEISVTYTDNSRQTLASGKEGMAPFIDSAVPLDLVVNGKDVKTVNFDFALECGGSAMKGTTVVSGTLKTRICGDPDWAGTVCLVGNETPIPRFDPLSMSSNSLQDGVKKIVFTKSYTSSQILNYWSGGNGKIFFKHEAFPILNFNFVHPTAGSFSGSYNAETYNDKVVTQYSLIENKNYVPPTDSDNDGIPDPSDQCPTQPETFNGYLDSDGCPDTPPISDGDNDGVPDSQDQCPTQKETLNGYQDTDGCPDISPDQKSLRINSWGPQILDIANNDDTINLSIGIQNYENSELAPSLKIKKLDGFVKQTFALPSECLTITSGWKDCNAQITLDLTRYTPDSYKIELSSNSRESVVSVPIEIVDTTTTVIGCEQNNTCDEVTQPTPDDNIPETIIKYFGGEETTTSSGVKITRSNTNFSEFGFDDLMIILILLSIVVAVALLSRFKKK